MARVAVAEEVAVGSAIVECRVAEVVAATVECRRAPRPEMEVRADRRHQQLRLCQRQPRQLPSVTAAKLIVGAHLTTTRACCRKDE